MSTDETRFSRTVKTLLRGEFICRTRFEELHSWLSDADQRAEVAEYLARIGRTVGDTSDGEAFFAGYADPTVPEHRQDISSQFQEFVYQLEPIARFLHNVMRMTRADAPLSPGDALSKGALVDQIDSTPALGEDLQQLTTAGPFKSLAETNDGRLEQVLNTLEKLGYLYRVSNAAHTYIATGKWSYYYDALQFIVEHGGVEEDVADPQQELLP